MFYRFFAIVALCLIPSLSLAQDDSASTLKTPEKEHIIVRIGEQGPLIRYSEAETAYLSSLPGDALILPVMATADNELIVCYQDSLEGTNAEDIFSERLEEVEELSVLDLSLKELHNLEFPAGKKGFLKTASLKRHLQIIETIRDKEKRPTKIVFELRKPWLHKQKNKDLSSLLLDVLSQTTFNTDTEIFISSYDPDELEHVMTLLPQYSRQPQLIFIMGDTSGEEAKQNNFGAWQSYDESWLYTTTGLRFLSSFVGTIAFDTKTMLINKEKNIDFIQRSKNFDLKFWLIEKDIRLDSVLDKNFTMDSIDGIASSQPERFFHAQIPKTEPEQEESTAPITSLLSKLNISTTQ